MNEADRKVTLAHLLELEERDDVARHLLGDHGFGEIIGDPDQVELDEMHLAEHKRHPVRL